MTTRRQVPVSRRPTGPVAAAPKGRTRPTVLESLVVGPWSVGSSGLGAHSMSSSKWGDPLSWRENHVAKPAFGFLAIGNSATSTVCFVISVNRLTMKPCTNLVLRAQLQMDFRRAAAPPRSRRGLSPPSQPRKAAAVRPEPRVLCASHSRLAACACAGPAALRSGAERTSGSPVPASPVPRRRDARGTGIGKYRLRF